jgi:DNA-binding NarL/FixJ family response regulator
MPRVAARLSSLIGGPGADWLVSGSWLASWEWERVHTLAQNADTRVQLAFLGPQHDVGLFERCMHRGVALYLDENTHLSRVVSAIECAQKLQVRILERDFAHETEYIDTPARPQLTPRQSEVLDLVSQGFRNRDIAHLLHITENTVEYHMRHLLMKFNARSRLELINRAIPSNLCRP